MLRGSLRSHLSMTRGAAKGGAPEVKTGFGMFDSLQSRLGGVFDKLRGRGALTEGDVDEALKEVRTALIEADVELGVVDDFIAKVRPRAEGEAVIRSVTPAQQVVKIVHDALIEMLGTESTGLAYYKIRPFLASGEELPLGAVQGGQRRGDRNRGNG